MATFASMRTSCATQCLMAPPANSTCSICTLYIWSSMENWTVFCFFFSTEHTCGVVYMLCILYLFWSLIGSFFVLNPEFFLSWHRRHVAEPMASGFFFHHHKGETLNAPEHCVHLTLCIVSPHETCHSLVHGIQVHGYFVRLARATWCWGGKGCGIWTDGAIGGMVCVVGMRGRQQGAGQSVCSCSINGLEARAWTQRMRDDGEKESRSQKRGQIQVERHWQRGGGVYGQGRERS